MVEGFKVVEEKIEQLHLLGKNNEIKALLDKCCEELLHALKITKEDRTDTRTYCGRDYEAYQFTRDIWTVRKYLGRISELKVIEFFNRLIERNYIKEFIPYIAEFVRILREVIKIVKDDTPYRLFYNYEHIDLKFKRSYFFLKIFNKKLGLYEAIMNGNYSVEMSTIFNSLSDLLNMLLYSQHEILDIIREGFFDFIERGDTPRDEYIPDYFRYFTNDIIKLHDKNITDKCLISQSVDPHDAKILRAINYEIDKTLIVNFPISDRIFGSRRNIIVNNDKKVISLDLFGMHIKQIPEIIGELKELERLDSSGNELESLPDSIGELRKLVYLNLDKNKLTNLPHSFEGLESLKELILSSNKFVVLPEVVKKITTIEDLDVSHNKIQQVRESVKNLLHLKRLTMFGIEENVKK